MSVSPRLPRHLRAALGPDAEGELVTILDEIRAEHRAQMARIDERSARIDAQFAHIDTQFARIDEQFVRIDQQFAHIDQQFARVDARFDRLEDKFDGFDERLRRLDTKVGDVKSDLMKWSFVFWCGAVASVAALAGVLR